MMKLFLCFSLLLILCGCQDEYERQQEIKRERLWKTLECKHPAFSRIDVDGSSSTAGCFVKNGPYVVFWREKGISLVGQYNKGVPLGVQKVYDKKRFHSSYAGSDKSVSYENQYFEKFKDMDWDQFLMQKLDCPPNSHSVIDRYGGVGERAVVLHCVMKHGNYVIEKDGKLFRYKYIFGEQVF